MRLKCLLKSLYRVVTKSINSHASVWNKPSRHLRISSIIKSIILPLFAKRGRGELGKETNRKIPGRFLTKTRGDFNGDKIIGRDPHVSPLDFLRMTILKIGRSLDDCLRNRGMTVNVFIFSLFLLFPNPSYSAICFLPDCHLDEEPKNVGVDAEYCEAAGYTYSASGACPANQAQDTCIFNPNYIKCDGTEWCYDNGYTLTSCTSPKTLSTPCPSNGLLYKYCVCPSTYKYACSGTGYSSGNGTACDSKYTKCNCSSNYTWSGSACVCSSDFKYSCSGTGYSSGSGTACGGKYKSCNCSTYYSWSGSACTHTHSYVCPSGYKESNSGMTNPTVTAKVCALSGCSSTSGICYKEGHSHSYYCPSGYSTSCSNGYSGTTSKVCSCGATSGTCYKCCADTYKYSCSGTGYSGGSGTSCNSKYTACNCASGYEWNSSACAKVGCSLGMIYYSDKTCSNDIISGKIAIGVIVKSDYRTVAMGQKRSATMYWSKAYTDTALSNHTYWEDARMDHKGQSNTSVIVAAHPDENSSNNAAIYCNEYSTAGTSAGDWYLPAAGELLTNVSENYDEIIPAITALGWSWENLYLWSSSEYGRDIVWLINSHEFAMTHGGKNSSRSVVCFLEVSNSL